MSNASTGDSIENLSHENRHFPPSAAFAAQANAKSDLYAHAEKDRLAFWEEQARELTWEKNWETVLEWNPPYAKWFIGGKINASVNALDRHVAAGRGDRVAFHFEGEPGDTRTITYAQMLADVSKAAHALTEIGIKSGDRVAIYMPMIPEAAVAMLACARIGAVHSVVFGGFSADALLSRIQDADAKLVITADGGFRKGAAFALKPAVDEALKGKHNVEKVLVVKRTGQETAWNSERDIWWHEIVDDQSSVHAPEFFDSEHPLFILYTSGTTAKPKGIFHTTGGYLTQAAYTHRMVFDIKPETDVYWCTADVGWITGHSYVVYGPLINGATQVMYEGTPDTPHKGRMFEIVAKYGVTILYTAPTLIRTWMKWGDEFPRAHNLSSLRLLGSVGEPINPEAWMWYREIIGANNCPIVDTWWQTETGAIMITPLPGATPTKPGTATLPFFGIDAAILDETGKECGPDEAGKLVIRQPWPSMLRTIYGDKQRYKDTYWSEYPGGICLAGDGARRDKDGNFFIVGRLDDVLNVSGHRLGTAEVEGALVSHPAVAEAAVIAIPDEKWSERPLACIVLKPGKQPRPEDFAAHLLQHGFAKWQVPDRYEFIDAVPRTSTGKFCQACDCASRICNSPCQSHTLQKCSRTKACG